MDLNDDSDRGERRKTPEGEPVGAEACSSSGGAGVHDDTEHYDPDPQGCATSLDQLVVALHEAFLEGSP